MKAIATTLLLWSAAIGAAVEATKGAARLADNLCDSDTVLLERHTDTLDRSLALLAFLYGAVSGALLADILARIALGPVVDELTMAHMLGAPELWMAGAGVGLLVGGFSAGAYKATKDTAPRTIRALMDWWR